MFKVNVDGVDKRVADSRCHTEGTSQVSHSLAVYKLNVRGFGNHITDCLRLSYDYVVGTYLSESNTYNILIRPYEFVGGDFIVSIDKYSGTTAQSLAKTSGIQDDRIIIINTNDLTRHDPVTEIINKVKAHIEPIAGNHVSVFSIRERCPDVFEDTDCLMVEIGNGEIQSCESSDHKDIQMYEIGENVVMDRLSQYDRSDYVFVSVDGRMVRSIVVSPIEAGSFYVVPSSSGEDIEVVSLADGSTVNDDELIVIETDMYDRSEHDIVVTLVRGMMSDRIKYNRTDIVNRTIRTAIKFSLNCEIVNEFDSHSINYLIVRKDGESIIVVSEEDTPQVESSDLDKIKLKYDTDVFIGIDKYSNHLSTSIRAVRKIKETFDGMPNMRETLRTLVGSTGNQLIVDEDLGNVDIVIGKENSAYNVALVRMPNRRASDKPFDKAKVYSILDGFGFPIKPILKYEYTNDMINEVEAIVEDLGVAIEVSPKMTILELYHRIKQIAVLPERNVIDSLDVWCGDISVNITIDINGEIRTLGFVDDDYRIGINHHLRILKSAGYTMNKRVPLEQELPCITFVKLTDKDSVLGVIQVIRHLVKNNNR